MLHRLYCINSNEPTSDEDVYKKSFVVDKDWKTRTDVQTTFYVQLSIRQSDKLLSKHRPPIWGFWIYKDKRDKEGALNGMKWVFNQLRDAIIQNEDRNFSGRKLEFIPKNEPKNTKAQCFYFFIGFRD